MAYKRYIKRGDNVYGPYVYHSYKKNGKVISKYLGRHKEKKTISFKQIWVFSLIGIIFFFGIFLMKTIFVEEIFLAPEEKFVLLVDYPFVLGEPIQGSVKINLVKGELIPLSTGVMINNVGDETEFLLSDLISAEINQGDFYVQGTQVSGTGEGFGVIGEKKIYPEVSFVIKITEIEKEVEELEKGKEPSEELEEIPENVTEEVPENITEPEEPAEPEPEEEIEEPAEEEIEEEAEEPEEEIEQPEEEIKEPSEEVEEEQETTEEPAEEAEEPAEPEEEVAEEEPEPEPEPEPEVLESPDEIIIEGVVTRESAFTYELEENEKAEIVSSSQDVKLSLEDGIVSITTDYFETEQGFGADYLTDELVVLIFDLAQFNLPVKEGELSVDLFYENISIASMGEVISVEEIPEENITLPEMNITEVNITIIGNLTTENATILTIQYGAVLGKPVKWKLNVKPDKKGELRIKIPKQAKNVNVYVLEEDVAEDLEDQVSSTPELNITNKSSEINITNETDSGVGDETKFGITGNVITETNFSTNTQENFTEIILDGTALEYEIEYETPAPYALEQEKPKGKTVKIIGPEAIHYENVLVFTDLNENLNIVNPSNVRIFWVEQNTYIPFQKLEDKDENGVYDYIEWIAPKLSNQTFEIIVIIKAEHLDENREFISDIYDQVKDLDDLWSETILDKDYVRVVFERELDSSNDITLYPRIINGNPRIEVYEINENNLITEFTNLSNNEYNKVLLTNLQGSQDSFDLRVLNGSIEIDHIIDPSGACFKGFCEFNDSYILADIKIKSVSGITGGDFGTQIKWDISELCDLDPTSIYDAKLQFYIKLKLGSPDADVRSWGITNQTWDETTPVGNISNQITVNETNGFLSNTLVDKFTNITVTDHVQYACNNNYDNLTIRFVDPDNVPTINFVSDSEYGLGDDYVVSPNYFRFEHREQVANPERRPKLYIKYPSFVTIRQISPLNNTYNATTGIVNFTCEINSSNYIKEVNFTITKYFGGWYVSRVINTTTLDFSGQSKDHFNASVEINLTNGFYTFDCSAINSQNISNTTSTPWRYRTGKGEVYIIHSIHTEASNLVNDVFSQTLDLTDFNPEDGENIYEAMKPAWRALYTDSHGNTNTMSWDMRMDELMCESIQGCSAIIDVLLNNATYNYSQNISYFNDGLGWHYHNMEWYNYTQWQYDGDNQAHIYDTGSCPEGGCQPAKYWNQILTLDNTIYRNESSKELAEKMLAIFIIDTKFYPITYVSGWLWENTDFSNWAENYVPFTYNNLYGSSAYDPDISNGVDNVFYWKDAPHEMYSPSAADYQTPGNLSRIIVPCLGGGLNAGFREYNYTRDTFALADNGTDVILCHYSHSYGNYIIPDTVSLHKCLESGHGDCVIDEENQFQMSQLFPDINFTYTNDVSMIQEVFELGDTTPSDLSINLSGNFIYINSSEELWKSPILAYKDENGDYFLGDVEEDGILQWKVNITGKVIITARAAGIDTSYNAGYSFLLSKLDILDPTENNPVNVTYPQNMSVNFTLQKGDTFYTSGITVLNITLNPITPASVCVLQGEPVYLGNNITQQNCSVPDLIVGDYYDLTLLTDHPATGLQRDTETSAVYYFDELNPLIKFEPPTPPNNTFSLEPNAKINVSLTELNLKELKFNWDGTDYIMYNDSLILMMNFDNVSALGENDTYVVDISKYRNDGFCSGATCPIFNESEGKYNSAYQFDGWDDYFSVPRGNIQGFTDFAIALWVKRTGSSQPNAALIGELWSGDSFKRGFLLLSDYPGYGFMVFNGSGSSVTTSDFSIDYDWTHIVAVFKHEDYLKVYKNGVEEVSTSTTLTGLNPNIATSDLFIGQYHYNNFMGLIDELQIWSRALDDTEIKELYYSNLYKYDTDKWILYINQSNLTQKSYSYYAYVQDRGDNVNQTETRILIKEETPPKIILNEPRDDSYSSNSQIIFNARVQHIADISNVSLYADFFGVFEINDTNYSGLKNTDYIFVKNISDGTYIWAIGSCSALSTCNISENRTLTIDTVDPDIEFVFPTESNNTLISKSWTYVNVSLNDTKTPNNLTAFINWNKTLVGWWRFNENTGQFANDSSGYGNNGTLGGGDTYYAPSWTYEGKFGSALEFDGSNDYVYAGSDSSLNITGEITLEAWVKFYSNGSSAVGDGGSRIISKDNLEKGYFLSIGVPFDQPNKAVFGVNGINIPNEDFIVGNKDLNLNTWYYIAGVKNSTHLSIYVDGVLDKSQASINPITNPNVILKIGAVADFITPYPFNGSIDEVKVWNRALSEQEIKASYNTGTYRLQNNFTNLDSGNYTYKAYVQDRAGNVNQTEERLLIINAPPTVLNVILNSSSGNNLTIDNLTVYYDSSDADGDLITNITDWRLNGTSIAVLNMPFDTRINGVGGIVKDYSTFSSNGILGNSTLGTQPDWISNGKVGGAYYFDGINDFINVTGTFDISQRGGVEAWFKPDEVKSPGGIGVIFVSVKNPTNKFQLSLKNEQVIGNYYDGSQHAVSGNISDTNWHHAVFVWNGSDSLLYVDGVSQNESSTIGIEDNEITLIGAKASGTALFAGIIDEVRIYNRSLSAEQISALYQAGLAGHSPETIVSQETSIGDVWSVALTPNDAYIDGETVLSNELEILNDPPVISDGPDLVPLVPNNFNNLNCSFNITDLESSNVYANYTWYRNNVEYLSGRVVATSGSYETIYLYSGNTSLGEEWICEIRPYDGESYGTALNSSAVTIANMVTCGDVINQPGNYVVNADEFDYPDTCITIDVSDVELDCKGHSLGGIDSPFKYGIYVKGVSSAHLTNVNVKNCDLTRWGRGIYNAYSDNGSITNINSSDNSYEAIYILRSNSNYLENITANENSRGVYIYDSNFNTFKNITTNKNNYNGVYIYDSNFNTFKNITATENIRADFSNMVGSPAMCDNSFENITVSGNYKFGYYNYSVSLENKIFSLLILCNADDSNLTNITLSGSASLDNNGLFIYHSDNMSVTEIYSNDNDYGLKIIDSDLNNFTNINSSGNNNGVYLEDSNSNSLTNINSLDNDEGVYIYSSNSNNLTNINTQNNTYGTHLYDSNSNNLTNINTQNNSNDGISLLFSDSNSLSNIDSLGNNNGVFIYRSNSNKFMNINFSHGVNGINISGHSISSCTNNVFMNSTISNNTNYGVYFGEYAFYNNISSNTIINNNYGIYITSGDNDNNSIYNNFFNNTNNYYIGTTSVIENFWNTTKTLGANIIGGPYIGGNFWATPAGDGFSETCTDSDKDGICDNKYTLDENNTDYLPLKANDPPNVKSVSLTPLTPYTNDTLKCIFNITDIDSPTLTVNVSWYRDDINFLNQTITNYAQGTNSSANLSNSYTHHDELFYCNVSAEDGFGVSGWNNSNSVTILNHTTTLLITNESDKSLGQQVLFTANYTKDSGYGIPGIGKEIGRLVWKNELDDWVMSVETFDCSETGRKGCVAAGLGDHPENAFQTFWGNGSSKYNQARSAGETYTREIVSGDLDDDGYINEFAGANSDQTSWFNETGRINYTDVEISATIILSDTNNDSIPEIIFGNIGNPVGQGAVFAYYVNGTQAWNNTILYQNPIELDIADLNDDGIMDIIAGLIGNNVTALNGLDGSVLWETEDLDVSSIAAIDLNSDGEKDEIAVGVGSKDITFLNALGNTLHTYNGECCGAQPDITVGDLNNDGIGNEIAMEDASGIKLLTCGMTDCTEVWSMPTLCHGRNIYISDFTDDGKPDVILGGSTNYACAFDNSGMLLFNYLTGGEIGSGQMFGSSPAIATGDLTGDGVQEILFGSFDNSTYVTREVSCEIEFNDSISANMTWNETSSLWEYNRSFDIEGIYEYNITCKKGGYETKLDSSILDFLNTLPTVELVSPNDNNVTTNRTPEFVWNGIDSDGDDLTYQLNITLNANSLCSDPERIINFGSPTPQGQESHILQTPLKCLSDNGDYYEWTVRANDSFGWGEWATPYKLNISAFVSINLTVDTISFGSMLPDQSNDTTGNNPEPFLIENIGNVFVNMTINATDLWQRPGYQNPTPYFQYKIDNYTTENYSFDWGLSQTDWNPVPDASLPDMAIVHFNWSDATDSAEVDINVTVPGVEEKSGDRQSWITFTASLDE